ncbi:MAG: Rrf2 family transcriptional regulator [Chromatiales bacterium]|nr:Rrf2 family transcriptional regulator [Chromatiales bacterium]
MKLSKRGEYGLKALIDLASQDEPTAVTQIKDIAAASADSGEVSGADSADAEKRGLLRSRAGVGGGYYLAKAGRLTSRWGRWCGRWNGPLAPISCVSQMAYERCVCDDESTCGLRLAMLDVRNAIEVLESCVPAIFRLTLAIRN